MSRDMGGGWKRDNVYFDAHRIDGEVWLRIFGVDFLTWREPGRPGRQFCVYRRSRQLRINGW